MSTIKELKRPVNVRQRSDAMDCREKMAQAGLEQVYWHGKCEGRMDMDGLGVGGGDLVPTEDGRRGPDLSSLPTGPGR